MDDLERQIAELTELTRTLQRQLDEARFGATHSEDEFYIPRLATEFQQSGQSDNLGGVYSKPFLSNLGERTYIGGYLDLEYSDPSGSSNREFDQHRFVPFFYSDVSDRVKLSAELEFEHGHEVGVEFAQLDYLFGPAFNFRAGIQLLPLGKLNEVHDSPIQDLTFRPLVDSLIIPTTLRDAGIGAYGELCEDFAYNVTLTNGFRGLDASGLNSITPTKGLDKAAPHEDTVGDPFENLNDDLAWTGRVAWTPELGVEVGASAHFDTYDELGDNDLEIFAIDLTVDGKAVDWLPDAMELLAEGARANIERDAFALAAVDGNGDPSPVAGDMEGYYVQANYHLHPGWLERWKSSGDVSDDAHFTFVTRYDDVRLDTYNRERITLGVNFRPNAHDTVFKLDYQINDDSGSSAGSNDDDAVVFSVATYF
ncbi:MAG: hypothetical protein ACYTG2_06325 [Planctomycetota bacterium]